MDKIQYTVEREDMVDLDWEGYQAIFDTEEEAKEYILTFPDFFFVYGEPYIIPGIYCGYTNIINYKELVKTQFYIDTVEFTQSQRYYS